MYELRPESIRTFITDPSIELPRFQRKSTWTAVQNFNLVLSVFRGFPIGVFVIKKEVAEGKSRRYLLDGRQRRHALKLMQDPEQIYVWARAALKFKANADPDDVAESFATYLQTFLGVEEWEQSQETPEAEAASLESELGATGDFDLSEYVGREAIGDPEANAFSSDLADDDQEQFDAASPQATGDISGLLQAILSVHPRRGRTSGITRLFDYRKFVDGIPYATVDPNDGKQYVDGRRLLTWLEFKRRFHDTVEFPQTPDQFVDLLLEDTRLHPSKTEGALRSEALLRWDRTKGVFMILRRLEDIAQEGVIGYLEIKDASPNDERKIFEIINTAGTPLTAAEILSAKPTWNETVNEPNDQLLNDVSALYNRMGIGFDGSVVKWDVPATLMDRIDAPFVFGKLGAEDPRSFERRLTFGFKLLAGHYAEAISKNDIAALAGNKGLGIPWSSREFDQVVARMIGGLMNVGPIKFWDSWNLSLLGATSDAVALNYMLLLLKDWIRKGEPTSPGAGTTRAFARNAVVLLDRSVFEYVNGDWRGSSDSRLASNLRSLAKWSNAEAVSEDRWEQLVKGIITDGLVNDQAYTTRVDPRIVSLLYYRNVILERIGPGNRSVAIHVDHIIPRTQFETETDDGLKANMHHITNLALLPQKENQQKSGRLLSEVKDAYLAGQISKLEDIGREDFEIYSSSSASKELKAVRGSMIIDDLTIKRASMLKSHT